MRWPMSRGMSRSMSRPMSIGDGVLKPFELASLFTGESGFLWGQLPYYQDPAGTTVASWGNPVGLINDDSGNGADFTQATVTARPVLGRVPKGGRRNLTPNSEVRSGSWVFSANTGRVPAASVDPDGYIADRVSLTGEASHQMEIFLSAPLPQGSVVTVSVYVYYEVMPSGYAFQMAYYDGSTQVTGAIGSVDVTPDMVGVWTRLEIQHTIPATAVTNPRIRLNGFSQGAEGTQYLFSQPQVEMSPVRTPYQAVISNYDITESGVPEIHYLHFDGTDDSVSTTLPAITNGTLVLAGTNGIWIDDDFNHAGGAFTVGPTTYTGGPDGILPIVGDLIVGGSFAIDRQLTAQERNRVINKLKSMGAPGVFELGPALVANGGPNFVDTTNWAGVGAGAELYVEDGELRVKNTVLAFGRARRDIAGIEPGQNYLARFSTRGVVGMPTTYLGYSNIQNGYLQVTNTSPITMSVAITAVSGENNIMFNLQNSNSSVENEAAVIYYSLRKLELIP